MPLSHAILAFLDYQPMSGYDLKKYFDMSVGHFWSATQSHIYKALEAQEKAGWVEAQFILQEGRPNRKEYYITPAGRVELRQWLTTPLPFEQSRLAWLIQIFFSHFSSNEEIIALLETRIAQTHAQLDALRGEVQAGLEQNAQQMGVERAQQLWQMTLDYGLSHYQHELQWLEQAIVRIRQLSPLVLPTN
jgi:DNA-binding PadR family transcriptional regulator